MPEESKSGPTAADLLWGSGARPKRGPKPSLSLDRIVAEAIALVDGEGLANLSMQRLAERLGYTKMSLYRYVPGRAELVALMIDHGIGAPPALAASLDWKLRLRRWTEALLARYLAHPWATELTVGQRLFGPNELSWLEVALTALADTPLTGAERLDTVLLLTGHVRNLAQQTAGASEDNLAQAMAAVLAEHGERFPATAAAFGATGGTPDDALRYGIDRILDGVAALIARRGAHS